MAADSLARQHRLLLPLALLLAGSAALAGGVTVSLFSRAGSTPGPTLPALRAADAVACAPADPSGAEPLAAPDPMAVLAAALGESRNPLPAATAHRAGTPALAGLLADSQDPPATPPAAAAAPAAPALAAPAIAAGYRLDLGYFLAPDQAIAFATQVQDRGVPVQLVSLPDASGRVWTHIRTPPFAGSAQALAGAERIERALGIPTRLVAPDPSPTPAAGVPAP